MPPDSFSVTDFISRSGLIRVAMTVIASIIVPVGSSPHDRRAHCQDAEPMYTNKLINETSPYLLQHAHNPVDWLPWGEEAFAKAKAEDKPIFLSVGYSTCYWCHVMEVESFENPDVAEVINKYFIPVKVDREERPDIDQQYMLATQLMTGRGGWPNSVWLTPDGRPWMAGTYFPRQRFVGVLEQIHSFWETRRDDVNRQADALQKAAEQASVPTIDSTAKPSSAILDQAAATFLSQFDARQGGFGGAPKFPPHGTLEFLIDRYRATRDPAVLEPITKTLDAMWQGGFHDHIGGGFHRYATDARWLLPHFEKMLYDNAQLIRVYAGGYELTGNELYRRAVADVYRWVKREMTSERGAFYSALDSGEVGKEGEAYIWSVEQLEKVLGEQDAALYGELYRFEPEGNFHEESTGELIGKNIPHLTQSLEQFATETNRDADDLAKQIEALEAKLLENRLTWPQPHRDDKVLVSWNALMIDALAYAGRTLDQPEYIDAAERAASFIVGEMVRDGQLLRTYRAGVAKQPAYLDDYAYLCLAMTELHRASGDDRWLQQARWLADVLLESFEDPDEGGFFFTGDDYEKLLARSKLLDGGGNLPNANGLAALALLRIDQQVDEAKYRTAAERTFRSLAAMAAVQPHTNEHLMIALREFLSDPEQLSGKKAGPVRARIIFDDGQIRPGESTEMQIELDIESGWHLYAPSPDADFVSSTQVRVQADDASAVGAIDAPESTAKNDPVFNATINTYSGTIRFKTTVTAKAETTAKKGSVTAVIKFQACDDSRCLEPQTITLASEFQIVQPD